MAGKLKWWYRVAAAALALWNAPAAAGYFEWSAAVDSGQVEWCGQTERQVAEVLEIDADEVRQAIDALMSGAPEDVRVLSVWGNEVYAQARKTWGGPVLFHSDDGGRSWRVVWTRDGYGDDYAANRVNAVLPDPVTGELWIGTSFGLFLGDEETDLPPSAVEVIALGADPARPGALWVATDNTNLTYQGQVSGAGFFRRRVSGGEVSWEDVSVGLGSRVEAVGFDAAEPERVYVRRKGSGQVIAALAPDVMTPELVGWTTVDAMPSPYRLGSVVLGEALRVPGSYPRHLVVSDIIDYLAKGQLGYPLALGGLLYTKSYWIHGGLRQTSLFRSRDGGVSWTGMGGHAHYDGRQTGAGELILWDNREQVLFSGNGLPHVAAQRVTTWCHHPLDAGTVYVVQRGRGHLYRSDDLSTWTELSAGLDPMLWPVSVAVDSLSRVYLATTDGTYRYDEAPRPYSLESVTLEPDTVRLGREGSVAVTVRVTSRAGDAAAPHVAVRLMGTAYEAADQGDGVHVAHVPLGDKVEPGFYGVTVSAYPAGSPGLRASRLHVLMVAPDSVVSLYGDGTGEDWEAELVSGVMDLAADGGRHGGWAHRIDGEVLYRHGGARPIHPFGYRLELHAAAADSDDVRRIQVNGARLGELDATIERAGGDGPWFRIAIPAEMLYREPRRDARDRYAPAIVQEIALLTTAEVRVDDVQLVPVGVAPAGPGTAVREGAAATPTALALWQNAPNPFNASTAVRYALPHPARARLSIYNAAGQRVRYMDLGWRAAGQHAVRWDGRDDGGRPVATGVYVYRLEAGGLAARKLMLLR